MAPADRLRIVFMGTPEFSVPALHAIMDAGHSVIAVYSQPPRPKGRGQHLQKSPVHLAADLAGIPVFNPLSFKKDPHAVADFAALGADVAVVAAYGLILPLAVLNAPRFGCLNIHASLLPRWRGASPIQRAIWSGDSESGVTIMQMEEGLDTGPMIQKSPIGISAAMTTADLHDALSSLGGKMIADVLDRLALLGRIDADIQDDSQSTYAPMLKKDDGRIDWSASAQSIDRQIRALNPWPGVWTMAAGDKRLRILTATLAADVTDDVPGTVIDRGGLVACGGGTTLRLTSVQPDSGKPMDASAAINGHYIQPGMVLI